MVLCLAIDATFRIYGLTASEFEYAATVLPRHDLSRINPSGVKVLTNAESIPDIDDDEEEFPDVCSILCATKWRFNRFSKATYPT